MTFQLELRRVGEDGEIFSPAKNLTQRMAHVELRARNSGVACIELGREVPAHVEGLQSEFLEILQRCQTHRLTEEILNVLEKHAGAKETALRCVVLERQIVVVGRPWTKAGV